ncbi:hypothetical protein Glove_202g97 [Diversispora epigaea]|uniref:Uncharacterized protein n=1 Tax=Diversispora epigaea TaxID=1348612 RepID=A0A397IMY0_9GLOM|nr:hypothetical protein Glove_202g97 [Diversispora epigaea]
MARVFDNTDAFHSAKKSGLKSDKAKLGLLNSALSAIYGIKFKTTNNKNTHYHLVGAFDNEDAPKLPSYQTGEGPFYESGEDIRYGYLESVKGVFMTLKMILVERSSCQGIKKSITKAIFVTLKTDIYSYMVTTFGKRQYPITALVHFPQTPQGIFATFLSYNFQSTRIIAIDGPTYNKLIRDGYVHWEEEGLLIPPLPFKNYISGASTSRPKGLIIAWAPTPKISNRQIELVPYSRSFSDRITLIMTHSIFGHRYTDPGINNFDLKNICHSYRRNPVKRLAQYIKENEDNLESEEINALTYNLAKTASSAIARSSPIYVPDITRKSNKEQAINQELREDEGLNCPEFFYLENVQERLSKYGITKSPSMQNLINVMIMLSMRPADVANLRIDYYKLSNADWYKSKYFWYCTGYAKNAKDEPRPLVFMEKDPLRTRELLIWIQKAIPSEFPFLIRDKDGDVNVHPINNFLAIYGISSSYLRKIRSDHAIDIHGGKTDSKRNRLHKLALRHKINREASNHYGVMNNRPNMCLDTSSAIPTPRPIFPMIKQDYDEVSSIIDLYGETSGDEI